MAAMALELLRGRDDARVRAVLNDAAACMLKHYEPKRRIMLEAAALDGSDLTASPDGRVFNPGHSIECAWFLLQALPSLAQPQARQIALDTIEGSLEFGWDKEFGGLFYFMDIENKPMLPLEALMKLWWPITETNYALLLAYKLTREARWLEWLEKTHAYGYSHFADPEFGEWFGYCDRRGELTSTCKGNNYKGFFHVPRFLLMSIQLIEQMNKGG